MNHKDLLVPAYIFDEPRGYFMVAIEPDGRVRVDGVHSKPAGVAEAKRLYESLTAIKPPAGTKYLMVKVAEIPPFRGHVNQGAIDDLNAISHLRRRGVL
ncbi:MAG: hypothetical protein ABFD89_29465 [Bryobacteraceae bacterium]